jgi:hypothetical protein
MGAVRRLTKTEEIYQKWLDGDEAAKAQAVKDLTNICASACGGLCPKWENRNDGSYTGKQTWSHFDGRWRARYPWCKAFVHAELSSRPDDNLRYIGRRCRQRMIDAIRAAWRPSRKERAAEAKRDSRGKFKPAPKTVKRIVPDEEEQHGPVKIIYQKYPGPESPSSARQTP